MNILLKNSACLALLLLPLAACDRTRSGSSPQAGGLTYKMTQVQKMSVDKEQTESRYTTVIGVDRQASGERVTLGVSFRDMAVSINSGGNLLQYDSRNKSGNNDQIAQAVQSVVGKQVTALTQPSMQGMDIQGYDIVQNSAGGRMFGTVLDRKNFEHALRMLFLSGRYLSRAPQVGDTWSDAEEIVLDDRLSLMLDLTYRVDTVETGTATVAVSGKGRVVDRATKQELGDYITVDESLQGSVQWNREKNAVSLLDARCTVVLEQKGPQDVQLVVEYMNVAELLSE